MKSEITLPLSDLKSALSGLSKLIGRKSGLPVLSHIRVTRTQEGQVSLQATDLDGFATYRIKGEKGEASDLLLPIEQLQKAVKCSGSSKQDVAILINGKQIRLRYGLAGTPIEQPVTSLPVKEWPPAPAVNVAGAEMESGFGEALKQALANCSQNSSRLVMRGACLDATKEGHYVVGTNGSILFSANSFTFPFKEEVIIPDSKFICGSGILDDTCRLALLPGKQPSSPKHVCFETDRWQFITRTIEGLYPDWKEAMPVLDGKWTRIKLLPPAIQQLLQVIPNLPGQENKYHDVRLRIEKVLWVEGRDKEAKDWTKVAIPDVEVNGKPQTISLNREYLIAALKCGLDEMAVLDALSPIVLTKGGKQVIIAPVIPEDATTTSSTSAPQPAQTNELARPTETPAENNAERKPEMSKTTTASPATPTLDSPFKLAMQQVDQVRENIKIVLRDLTTISDTLKLAEKEKKANEKEIEQFRDKLREIQGMKI